MTPWKRDNLRNEWFLRGTDPDREDIKKFKILKHLKSYKEYIYTGKLF